MAPKDLEYMVAYQIGALKALACYAGASVTLLKPHGAPNNIPAEHEDLAMAIRRAIKTVDPELIYVALADSEMQRAAERLRLPLAREGFADRLYDDNANLASRMLPNTVIKDPEQASTQVVRMVTEGEVVSLSGKTVKVEVDTICVHGDEPTAVHVAGKVREELEAAVVEIVPLINMELPS